MFNSSKFSPALKGGVSPLPVPAPGPGNHIESFDSWIERQSRELQVFLDRGAYSPELLGSVEKHCELTIVLRYLADYREFVALSDVEGCYCSKPGLTCCGMPCTSEF